MKHMREWLFLPDGNVGINQVNPTAKLEVNGTSLFNDQNKLDVTTIARTFPFCSRAANKND